MMHVCVCVKYFFAVCVRELNRHAVCFFFLKKYFIYLSRQFVSGGIQSTLL